MSVRTAELLMALLLTAASIALMFKSAELNIGWVKDRGPGAGAWPFWLSTIMLLSCLAILWRWFRGTSEESRSDAPYVTQKTLYLVGTVVLALVALLVGTQYIGLYLSLVVFMLFFLRIMGRHSWTLTLILSLATPVVVFGFFEWALQIPLPKGMSEPLFYPIYDLMY
ncbi:MAG: tripartite tricarboxylate transporter TctB family protein [Geminicoccaceae bacterium]|nr:tripartite tricarboxylate transporter TctB family protein [Geminicoccaceae bacterium]